MSFIKENSWRRVLEIFKGNVAALELMQMIHEVAHIWDDLIDRDREVNNAEINRAFWHAIVGIRRNPFYRQHYQLLDPVIDNAVMNYLASVDLEKGTEEDRAIAHVARTAPGDVAITIAGIVGGYQWAAAHAAEIKAMSNADTVAHFQQEMEEKYNA